MKKIQKALILFILCAYLTLPYGAFARVDEGGGVPDGQYYKFTVTDKEIKKYTTQNGAEVAKDTIYFRNPRVVIKTNYVEKYYTQDPIPESAVSYLVIRGQEGLHGSEFVVGTYFKANPNDILSGNWQDITVLSVDGNPVDIQPSPDPVTDSSTSSSTGTTTEEDYYGLNPGTNQGDLDSPSWHTVFGTENVTTYQDWLKLVWNWAMAIMIPLSVLIFTAAGVIYTISEGDSKRIELAKRMIIGVVSGVGLLILSRVFLLFILGEEGAQWLIFF